MLAGKDRFAFLASTFCRSRAKRNVDLGLRRSPLDPFAQRTIGEGNSARVRIRRETPRAASELPLYRPLNAPQTRVCVEVAHREAARIVVVGELFLREL